MTPEQRQEVIRLLEQGEELSPEWARILFPPERREYELIYHGKEREEDILANTMAVPLQAVRTFGRNGGHDNGWENMLIFGDNLQVMKSLLEMKKAGKLCNADGTPGVRLAYIDPPFATKREFSGTQDQKAYQDKIAGASFIEFLRKRLILLRELLAEDGVIYVHLDQKKSHYMKVVMDEVFGESRFITDLIWQRVTAHGDSKRWGVIHDSLLCYAKGNAFTWNPQFVPYSKRYIETKYCHKTPDGRLYRLDNLTSPHARPNMTYEWRGHEPPPNGWRYEYDTMERLFEEGRIEVAKKKGGRPQLRRFLDEMPGSPVGTLWTDIAPVNSQATEVTGYPTQKPEGLLSRIVRASSSEGDIVLDCFAGAGTSGAVAEKLRRRWIAVDCGKLAIYTMQKRMLNLSTEIGSKGKKLRPRPFTLYNAGLYDFSRLRELPWDSWRFFALQLFQCRGDRHRVGGIELDGRLKGASVLVFNHMKEKGVRIDEETIDSLHHALGSRIGNKLFLIAPALTFDFQQDYIDLDGVRYYALRIPYSIIHELHNREFTALKQPTDEMEVNDTVDAVGFDFIRTPELKFSCGRRKPKGQLFDEAYIRITTFKSEAIVREALVERANLETLSMVMLDFDYDVSSQVFDLDAVFYGDAIRSDNGEVRFRCDDLGDKVMAVIIDIYGNESRVLIDAARFGNGRLNRKRAAASNSAPNKKKAKTSTKKTASKKKKTTNKKKTAKKKASRKKATAAR